MAPDRSMGPPNFRHLIPMNIRIAYPLLLAIGLTACSTPSARLINTPIRAGMTRAELVAEYGPPLRTEPNPNGGEDWFYTFGVKKRESWPVSEAVVSETERSYSFTQASATTTTMTELPVHLSPEGRVIEPLPVGSVVVK
jgi:outer membrane protein assembly factor BamE (lipoprotein component of BamABCDE complex)